MAMKEQQQLLAALNMLPFLSPGYERQLAFN
jgi:hypothetical protein